MSVCCCLWGGYYNPIVPIFKKLPNEWQDDLDRGVGGYDIARGYIQFFEPDVFVESEEGLAKKIGLAHDNGHIYNGRFLALDDFYKKTDRFAHFQPSFGLDIFGVLRHIYQNERRFKLREENIAIECEPSRISGLAEALFGVYPAEPPFRSIRQAYNEVYEPKIVKCNSSTWRKVFMEGAITPLRLTRYLLDENRRWHDDVLVYIFDPRKVTDLIDLWNLRLEPSPVLPVPVDWVAELSSEIVEILDRSFRPVAGNTFGAMHRAYIEISRSLDQRKHRDILEPLKSKVDTEKFYVKTLRNAVWAKGEEIGKKYRRIVPFSNETMIKLDISDDLNSSYGSLGPVFIEKTAQNDVAWVNVLRVRSCTQNDIATVIPFNSLDVSWPRLGSYRSFVGVGSEGWVFPQSYLNFRTDIQFLSQYQVIIEFLKRQNISAEYSDPGRVAKQIFDHLGGIFGLQLLADAETLRLLNTMAGGIRRRTNYGATMEEHFDRRSKSISEINQTMIARNKRKIGRKIEIKDLVNNNVMRLGVETYCEYCKNSNWVGLDILDYKITCERCLNQYPFPQHDIMPNSRNWRYRVIGPFAVPDFARGAYSALLSIRVLSELGNHMRSITFSTALCLNIAQKSLEVDYACLWTHDNFDNYDDPQIIFGEAKSFGSNVITEKEIEKFILLAEKMPGAIFVFSILRSKFESSEIKLLKQFNNYILNINRKTKKESAIILLTETELLFDFSIHETWRRSGGRYKEWGQALYSNTLHQFAEATQHLYAGADF